MTSILLGLKEKFWNWFISNIYLPKMKDDQLSAITFLYVDVKGIDEDRVHLVIAEKQRRYRKRFCEYHDITEADLEDDHWQTLFRIEYPEFIL